MKKIFTGGIAIRVSKYDENKNAKTLSFPKIAPFMTVLLPLLGILGNAEGGINPLFWLVAGVTAICVFFGFFYYSVFKSELPKTDEELADDIFTIGFSNKEIKFADDSEKKDEMPQAVVDVIKEYKEEITFDKTETETETEEECGEDCECHNVEEDTEDQEIIDLAIIDDLIVEEVADELEEELDVPTMKNTKGEIISYLEAKGIDYKKGETKAKLIEKI
jgi:hypothetical protein